MSVSDDNLLAFARSYGGDDHFLEKTWDTFEISKENERAVEVLRGMEWFKIPGAYIHGPTGSGKTHAMKALFNHALRWRVEMHEKGYQINQRLRWISMSHYLDSLRDLKSQTPKVKAQSATTLFIDDLGASMKTDWAMDQIFQLIDYRAERELQTFITSNWSIDELGTNYSKRISSRVSELCVPVPMFCPDYRQRKMKQHAMTTRRRLNERSSK